MSNNLGNNGLVRPSGAREGMHRGPGVTPRRRDYTPGYLRAPLRGAGRDASRTWGYAPQTGLHPRLLEYAPSGRSNRLRHPLEHVLITSTTVRTLICAELYFVINRGKG